MFRARPAGPASGFATAARGSARGAGLLARIVHLVVSVVVLIIVVGIVLVVLKANPTNSIVSEVHDWARWLAGPFDRMFTFDNARVAVAVNWGIAAVVYLFVGALIARLLGRSHR
jgi:uncharacterized protein involved in cysteine biosynthesis